MSQLDRSASLALSAVTPLSDDATDDVYCVLRRSSIDPTEVEQPGTEAVEISIRWGSAVVHVTHIDVGASFALSSTRGASSSGDFVIDESMLPSGQPRVEIVRASEHGPSFAAPRALEPSTESDDGVHSSLDGSETRMERGRRYRAQAGGLIVTARVVAKPRALHRERRIDRSFVAAGIGTLATVAALLGVAHWGARDDGLLTASNDEDRLALLQDFVHRMHERAAQQPETLEGTRADGPAAAPRARDTEGRTGHRNVAQRNGRMAIARHASLPQVGRPPAGESLAARGAFAALEGSRFVGSGASGTVDPFAGLASGDAPIDTMGVDGLLGDGQGFDGLGRLGIGHGGGGDHDTVAVGELHGVHGTCGGADCGSFGRMHGRGHLSGADGHGPIVRPAAPTVVGMNPEVIRRVVRRNLAQVAHCHEQGLSANPELAGRVVVRFVIAPTGTVLGSSVQESNLAVPSVASCVASAVRRWTFDLPSTQSEPVTVSYPFVLSPAE